jgi:hypothetical protein
MLLRPVDCDATEARLSQWQSKYPNSRSAINAHCALCHAAKADQDAGAEWNGYGQALQQNGSNFTAVEQVNSRW